MKVCTNCGKVGFVNGDAYSGVKVFCKFCGSNKSAEIKPSDVDSRLKYVKKHCRSCGKIIDEKYKNWNVCPYCYG